MARENLNFGNGTTEYRQLLPEFVKESIIKKVRERLTHFFGGRRIEMIYPSR